MKVEVYLDHLCPYCGRFERANGAELDRLIADGTVWSERYSTRAANAVGRLTPAVTSAKGQ